MNISIIIPNYNGEELLEKNLPQVLSAVENYQKGKIEIIIPDDPSTDNSHKVIAAFLKSLEGTGIIGKTTSNRNKKIAGFSRNVNRGVALSTGDILILLNSDVVPHKGFLDPLIAAFADDEVFAVGCLDESEEQGKVILRGRGVGRWHRGFLEHAPGDIRKRNTLWASGGSSAFRKSVWERLHGMDFLYDPFYWEDIDLSYRALKSGYKVLFCPESIVRHQHETGTIQTTFTPAHIKKIAYRNQIIFVWKNITETRLLLEHILTLPYHCLIAIVTRDWAFLAGLIQASGHFSQVMKARRIAKKLFVRKDSVILREHHT